MSNIICNFYCKFMAKSYQQRVINAGLHPCQLCNWRQYCKPMNPDEKEFNYPPDERAFVYIGEGAASRPYFDMAMGKANPVILPDIWIECSKCGDRLYPKHAIMRGKPEPKVHFALRCNKCGELLFVEQKQFIKMFVGFVDKEGNYNLPQKMPQNLSELAMHVRMRVCRQYAQENA